MRPISVIRPRATYTVAEVACMLDQSPATVRRLIDRRHLARAPGVAAVRIPHGSLEAFISTGAAAPINLLRELKENGPCLVLDVESIAQLYNVHVQTVYRMVGRGSLPTVKWLWCRRILKSEITRIWGSAPSTAADPTAYGAGVPGNPSAAAGWVRRDSDGQAGSSGASQTFYWHPPSG